MRWIECNRGWLSATAANALSKLPLVLFLTTLHALAALPLVGILPSSFAARTFLTVLAPIVIPVSLLVADGTLASNPFVHSYAA